MATNQQRREDASRTFTFGPRDFVHGPFVECPKCKQHQFGIVSINGRGYSRRCKSCLYPIGTGKGTLIHVPLPSLHKSIIYLDQPIISEMMKALNPKTKANQKNRVRAEWRMAFEKLDTVCKLQLTICPDSLYHHDESYVHQHYSALKRIYELFSHGVSFRNGRTIKDTQLRRHYSGWLSRSAFDAPIERRDALPANVDDWNDRIQITIKSDYDSDFADDIRKNRAQVHEEMRALFADWHQQRTKKFMDWYEPELRGFGLGLMEQHDGFIALKRRIQNGEIAVTSDNMWPPHAYDQVRMLLRICLDAGNTLEKACESASNYMRTADFSTLPYVRISALLLAGIARRAAAGQKRPPSQGMANDINMVATMLPYCDAMFVDKEIHGLLQEGDIRERLGYSTRVFSTSDFIGFFTYLDEIRLSATAEHLAKVREVYGAEWGKPYVEVFESDDETASPRSD